MSGNPDTVIREVSRLISMQLPVDSIRIYKCNQTLSQHTNPHFASSNTKQCTPLHVISRSGCMVCE